MSKFSLTAHDARALTRQLLAFTVVAVLLAASIPLTTNSLMPDAEAQTTGSDTFVISRFQVAGSASDDDFIEIFNRSDSAQSLDGHRVVYAASSGTVSNVEVFAAGIIVPAGGYYLLGNSTSYTGALTPDATFTQALSGAAAGASLAIRDGDDAIIDAVRYGTNTNGFVEGTATTPTPATNRNRARFRFGCQDTDNNSADFVDVPTAGENAPRNSDSPQNSCALVTNPTTPIIDGVISPGEYGDHTEGRNQYTSGTPDPNTSSPVVWYMTWDEENLYVAIDGASSADTARLIIDANPLSPAQGGVAGGTDEVGNLTSQEDGFALPFRADFEVDFGAVVLPDYGLASKADGAGGWTTPEVEVGEYLNDGVDVRELKIPWSEITNGVGRPASFAFLGYVDADASAATTIYGEIPVGNPSGVLIAGTTFPEFFSVRKTQNNNRVPFRLPSNEADLDIVTLTDSIDPVTVNTPVVFNIETENRGPADATGTTLEYTLDGSFIINSVTVTQGAAFTSCSVAGNVVTCAITDGNFDFDDPKIKIEVNATPTTAGSFISVATISADQTDPIPENNSESERTTVVAEPALNAFTLSPRVIGGCQSGRGTVTLSDKAPTGGVTISLSSSDPAVAAPPPSVTIPAGQRSASFTVTTSAVSAATNVDITATLGASSLTRTVAVVPPGVLRVDISPNPAPASTEITGTVTLQCAAGPGGVTVSISSNKPERAQVLDPTIVIAEGDTTGTFRIQTGNVSTAQSVTITATANGVSARRSLRVEPVLLFLE